MHNMQNFKHKSIPSIWRKSLVSMVKNTTRNNPLICKLKKIAYASCFPMFTGQHATVQGEVWGSHSHYPHTAAVLLWKVQSMNSALPATYTAPPSELCWGMGSERHQALVPLSVSQTVKSVSQAVPSFTSLPALHKRFLSSHLRRTRDPHSPFVCWVCAHFPLLIEGEAVNIFKEK